jgi:hypothetical protein
MADADPRLIAEFEKAVQAAVARQLSVQEAVSRIAAAMVAPSPEQVMEEYWRLLPKLGRGTATTVARKFAASPAAALSLARKIRGWRKKNGRIPFEEPEAC